MKSFALVLLSMFLTFCAAESEPEEAVSPAAFGGYDRGIHGDFAPPPEPAPSATPAPVMEDAPSMLGDSSGGPMDDRVQKKPAPDPAAVQSKRLLHYKGYAKVAVSDPKKTIETLSKKVLKMKGVVVSQNLNRAEYKVPLSNFLNFYKEVLELGKVLSKSLSLEDLTNKFTDLKLRKEALLAAKKRFEDLLSKAQNAQEKIMILAEIEKIQVRLKAIELSLAEVRDKAKYSNLTVEFTPLDQHLASLSMKLPYQLSWIAKMAPGKDTVFYRGQKSGPVKAPKGFLLFERKDIWKAQSASKSQITMTKLKNQPRGTSQFWSETIRHHLSKKYAKSSLENWGKMTAIHFRSHGKPHYTYLVAVMSKDEHLYLMQTFFPNPDEEKRHLETIKSEFSAWASKI